VASTPTNGNDNIRGTAGNDVIRALNGNDTVRGDGGNDDLFGQDGNDRLFGALGDDDLFGGRGDDALSGGEGRDRLFGQEGDDVLDAGVDAVGDVFNFIVGENTALGDDIARNYNDLHDFINVGDLLTFADLDTNRDRVVDDADRFVREVGGDLVLDLGRAAGVSPRGAETLTVEDVAELDRIDFRFEPFEDAIA
jgi:Ca2+-binding RTX toxin-like protein